MVLDKLKIKNAPATFAPMAAAHNRLVAVLQAMLGINGIKVSMTEANIFIEYTGVVGTGGTGPSGPHPFKVLDAGAGEVLVVFGQVNSVTPTIGGVALDATTVPLLAVASGVVYLYVSLGGDYEVSSVLVLNAASLPTATEFAGFITLATVTVAGGEVTAINQSVGGSLQHLKCGELVHVFGSV